MRTLIAAAARALAAAPALAQEQQTQRVKKFAFEMREEMKCVFKEMRDGPVFI